MDRDYMKDQRRQRPFSPPPERSVTSTLIIVIIFVAALFALYKIADWKLDQRTAEIATDRAGTTAKSIRRQTEPPVPPFPQPPRHQDAPEAAAGTRIVTKCVINGKTSYGDSTCSQGATSTLVTTRADHNLMAPVRPQATPPIEEPVTQPIVVSQINPSPDAAAKKTECQYLNAEIAHLDAVARQPQSMQMQDWIKDQRKKLRDRQFRIQCQ